MPNEAYAASVVKEILKQQPAKWFWQGNRAWIIWFLDRFFPRSVWVYGTITVLADRAG
jgi:1-acylglycerone phosphate reductase